MTLTLSFPDWSITATGRDLSEAVQKILVHLIP